MKRKKLKIRIIASFFILFYLFCSVIPVLLPFAYSEMVGKAYEPMTLSHIFGTDALGRDVLLRVCVASKTSIHIACFSVLCSLIIGVHYGCIAGYFHGLINSVLTSIIDIIDSIPDFLCAMLLMTFFNGFTSNGFGGITGIFVTLILTSWTSMARLIKNEVSVLVNEKYVVYAKLKRASFAHIYFWHLLPNLKGTIIAIIVQKIPPAIFLEAFLSFVGIGIQPPYPSLGKMISDGVSVFRKAPHLLLIPSCFLFVIILLFNLASLVLAKEN